MSDEPSSTVTSRSLMRERAARKEAETLLEQKSRELYDINLNLRKVNAHLEDSEARYRSLVDLIPDAIWIHSGGKVVFVNAAALTLLGASDADQLLGTDALARVPEQFRHLIADGMHQNVEVEQQLPRCAIQIERLDGRLVDVEFFGCEIRFNDTDSIMHVVRDITERRQHEMVIEHQATHDQLTGLPNRALFLDRLATAIRRAERQAGQLAVMFVDLDKFKNINDALGHSAGDELLREVARQLSLCVRESDTVARLGGDEFVLLLDNPLGETTPALVAERISTQLMEPVELAGQAHVITGSIGISIYPDDSIKAEVLLRQADIAMYRAKEDGRNGFHFFTHDMQQRLDARVTLEQGMHRALQHDQFVLHYQPQMDLRTGRIIGMEALLRWQSPELGLVPPIRFIPIAEESNLILTIGEWVLDKVCSRLRAWQDSGVPLVPVAINVAASQFSSQALDELVVQALTRHGVDPKLLELELTESLSMADPEASIALMHSLKATGVSMSIDDFGTGYSNLSYLKRFPVDKLKVDQSFTRGLTNDLEDRSITTAVIRLAHSLGLRAIAEGVETEGQLRLLAELGCDEIQGYYFSRPLTEQAMTTMLTDQSTLDLAPINRRPQCPLVLLIDDEPHVLSSFGRLLRGHPYQLLTARNFAEAYELLAGQDVAIVISDQELIGETGVDFLERIKQLYPRAVRVLLSGHDDARMFTGAINNGAIFKFISKPWDNAQVLEVLASALIEYNR